MSLAIGPFLLDAPVGAGGMATVWRAHHVASGLKVAVKVMQGERARDPRFVATFNEEVRHVVALSHPAVITVLDYGLLPDSVADVPGATLVPASPYLVMEYASGFGLDQVPTPVPWPALADILSTLLGALSHAHARGVLHLDIKPANVLRVDEGDALGAALRLSDFGLARAFRETPEVAVLAGGTPEYMPPEQLERRWRDQGPWTDLYALGCMAWQLATGSALFHVRGDPYATARLHLTRSRPVLLDPDGMPAGFASWVQRLIAWDPADRPPNAATAARELTHLRTALRIALPGREGTCQPDGAVEPAVRGNGAGGSEARTLDNATFVLEEQDGSPDATPTTERTPGASRDTGTLPNPLAVDAATRTTVGRHAELNQAAQATVAFGIDSGLPEALRVANANTLADPWSSEAGATEELTRGLNVATETGADTLPPHAAGTDTPWLDDPPPVRVLGAGLGLLPLRRFPLVGRHAERDELWRALSDASQKRTARVILVEGALGVGRTRLATAVAERALEQGAAHVLHVMHERVGGSGDGLTAAIAKFLRVDGLDPERQDRRLDARFGEGSDVGPLLRGSLPQGIDERDRAAWRHAALTRLLSRLAGPVPWLVIIDDAEWGAESLAFVLDVLAGRGKAFPALILVCTHEHADTPVLHALRARNVPRMAVPPLPDTALRSLLTGYLALDDSAAAEVARRAAGNVLLAVQMVRAWADRGLLEQGADGYAPVDHAPMDLGVRQVWGDALHRIAEEFGDSTLSSLRVAAALGVEVALPEWSAALEGLGQTAGPPSRMPRIVEALLRAGLAASIPQGWRFAHPLVHELLEDELRASGEWTRVHGFLAEQLRGGAPLRRARHLHEAGRSDEAVDLVLDAARQALATHAFREVARAVDTLNVYMRALPEGDRRRTETRLLESPALLAGGAVQDSAEVAARAAEEARAQGWPDLHARAVRYRAFALEKAGARAEAEAAFAEAQALAALQGDALDQAICLEHRGTLARMAGDLAESRTLLEHALLAYRALQQPRHIADALKELGGTLVRSGNRTEAHAVLTEARSLYHNLGSDGGAAEALNNLAELARTAGRLDEAESCYKEAFTAMDRLGHAASVIPMVNLAQVQLARKDWREAARSSGRALEMATLSGRRAAELYARAFGAPCHAVAGQWDAWDDALVQIDALTTQTGLRDPEVADALELGAACALSAKQTERAGRARVLATRHR